MSSHKKGLPKEAFETMDGEKYPPYVPADVTPPEFTFKAVTFGALLAIVFGAANAYLGLKVGLTVSASIPAAVMAIAFFSVLKKVFGVKSNILEPNMVQTVGSAGESLAAGVIFTIPALFLLGLDPSILRIAEIAFFGGTLGVLFMIPLRRYLIVKEHGKLPFPEGVACAEVLVAGEGGASGARVFQGLGIGAAYAFLASIMGAFSTDPSVNVPGVKKATIAMDATPELLGVGYILGPRIAAIMLAGGLMGWLVIIPLIATIGDLLSVPIYPAPVPISELGAGKIWHYYVRYIGAGAVLVGGIITLIRSLPTMIQSFKLGLSGMSQSKQSSIKRTQRDINLKFVMLGALAIALLIWISPTIEVNLLAAILIVIFTLFFVTVSSRIVGLVGSSSSPVSGMTIATLLITSVIFYALGWTEPQHMALALTVGAVICISAAIAGDISQDLKTGFLLGATPRKQQWGELVGVLASAATIGFVLLLLNKAFGFGSKELAAPQATLMKMVVEGVLTGEIPWGLVFVGCMLGLLVELFAVPVLPFAVGLYLPISLSTPIMAGGVVRWWVEKRSKGSTEPRDQGVLFASGLIAGAALIGILKALLVVEGWDKPFHLGWVEALSHGAASLIGFCVFGMLALILLWSTRVKKG